MFHNLLGSLNRKGILAVVGNVAAPAKYFGSLVHGLIQHVRVSLHADAVFVSARIDFPESVVGNQNAAVFIVLAKHAFGLFHDANHPKRRSINHYVLANGRNIGKEHGRGIFAEHYHFFAVQIVAFADESAVERRGVGIYGAKIRLHTAEINGGNFAVLGAHRMRLLPPDHKNSEVLYRGT